MMQSTWWMWAIAGLFLIMSELVLPAFVLVWFGLGALVVSLLMLLLGDLSMTAQFGAWLVLSLALVVLWFRIFKPGFHKTRIGQSDASAVGEVGVITREVAPFAKGEVRFQRPMLGSDVWPCIADETMPPNTRVKVMSVEGSFLKVGRA